MSGDPKCDVVFDPAQAGLRSVAVRLSRRPPARRGRAVGAFLLKKIEDVCPRGIWRCALPSMR
jgi:hypothetical protein